MALQRSVYWPRDAEHTVLHQVIAEHLEVFLRAVAEAGDGTGLPAGSGPASLIRTEHRQRLAVVDVRQSTPDQVRENTGSTAAQKDLVRVAEDLGWPESRIRLIDSDLGQSGTSGERLPR
jgi:hypothetical protein